jgi:flagellar protein FlbD
MIYVTRLNGERFVVNAEVIQQFEAMPDTIMTLLNGEKLLVRESVEDLIAAVVAYKRRIHAPAEQ